MYVHNSKPYCIKELLPEGEIRSAHVDDKVPKAHPHQLLELLQVGPDNVKGSPGRRPGPGFRCGRQRSIATRV